MIASGWADPWYVTETFLLSPGGCEDCICWFQLPLIPYTTTRPTSTLAPVLCSKPTHFKRYSSQGRAPDPSSEFHTSSSKRARGAEEVTGNASNLRKLCATSPAFPSLPLFPSSLAFLSCLPACLSRPSLSPAALLPCRPHLRQPAFCCTSVCYILAESPPHHICVLYAYRIRATAHRSFSR